MRGIATIYTYVLVIFVGIALTVLLASIASNTALTSLGSPTVFVEARCVQGLAVVEVHNVGPTPVIVEEVQLLDAYGNTLSTLRASDSLNSGDKVAYRLWSKSITSGSTYVVIVRGRTPAGTTTSSSRECVAT